MLNQNEIMYAQAGLEPAFARTDPADGPSSKVVLLVDDDAKGLEYLCRVLEGQGLCIVSCTNYALGAELVESGIFDFVMVSQGGREFKSRVVVERAREIERRPPVIVVTRALDMNCYLEAMESGAADYLEKPIPAVEVQRVIRAARGRSYLPEHNSCAEPGPRAPIGDSEHGGVGCEVSEGNPAAHTPALQHSSG